MKSVFYILIMGAVIFSCTPEPLPQPNPCPNPPCDTTPIVKTTLELMWNTALRPDSFYTITDAYALWKDHVVYGIDQTNKGKLAFFEVENGNRTGIWDGQNRAYSFKDAKLYHDRFYLTNSPTLYVFDELDMVREFFTFNTQTECGPVSNGFSFFGDYLYVPSTECKSSAISDYARIRRIDIHSNQREVVFQLNTVDSFGENRRCYLDRPAFWVSPDGDTCMLQTYGSIPKGQSMSETGVLLYNISRKRTEWHLRKFNPRGELSLRGPLVSGDRAYMVSLDSIHCIDIPSGKRLWAVADINSASGFIGFSPNFVDLHLIDNKLYFYDSEVFVCLDANTGAIIYNRNDQKIGRNNSTMTYFENVFYFTSGSDGRLYGVRASDGKAIMMDRSPNRGGKPFYDSPNFGYSGVVIDEEKRLLYTADGHFALCFKIPADFGK